jgi:glycosyltransferase involved in cell wall biosynthesis
MRHWRAGEHPSLPGVKVIGLSEPGRVYTDERRAFGPPLRFGLSVGRHLARQGRRYDVVHVAAFPYFPLLAAGALRRRGRYELFADWHEVWTAHYWRRYAGTIGGTAGWLVQRACARLSHGAFCDARMHAERLTAEGYRGTPTVLPGLYSGPIEPSPSESVDGDLVVYAGRHVPEKRVDALVHGFSRAREQRPGLRLEIYGDGPTRSSVEHLVSAHGLSASVRVVGRAPEEDIASALARAACVATASEREGYGLVVVEAAARGTPSVVVAGPENAATELVRDGVNGAIARDASPEAIAHALLRVVDAGTTLRASTAAWFSGNAETLTLERSLEVVLDAYTRAQGSRPTSRDTVSSSA